MNRKTIIVLVAAVVISVVLLVVMSFLRRPATRQSLQEMPVQTTKGVGASLLSATSKGEVAVGESFTIAIILQTGDHKVNGAQLEMHYDPQYITITDMVAGDFFVKPLEYVKKNDTTTGEIIYALGSFEEKNGGGMAVKITAKANKKTNGNMEILTIKPSTLVIASDDTKSVLDEAKGASIVIR